MRKNSSAFCFRLSLLALFHVACFIALNFGLVKAAQDNSNSGVMSNNSKAASANQVNKSASQGNKNAGGGNQNTNTSNDGGGTTTGGTVQSSAGGTTKSTPSQLQSTTQLVKDLKVMGVATRFNPPKGEPEDRAGLYNTIRVKVEGLKEWVRDPANHAEQFILYINGYPLKAVRGRKESQDSDDLLFDLRRTDDPSTQASWRDILNRPKLLWPELRPSQVSIGYLPDPNQPDVVRVNGSASLQLVDVNPFWFGVFIAFLIIAFIIFILFAIFSNMIRDPGRTTTAMSREWSYRMLYRPILFRQWLKELWASRRDRGPFSLGRTQIAFWFFIIIASYIFIWMVAGDGDTITGTVLGLMGISATTALGAVLIDRSKSSQAQGDRISLEAEQQALTTRINELTPKTQPSPPSATPNEVAELDAKRKRLYEVAQQLAALPAATVAPAPRTSEGFLVDILSDADGVSFHRFQIAAWTLALGFIFVAQVFNSLSMPDFNGTLLALLGISSGTYLGFKLPEKQT